MAKFKRVPLESVTIGSKLKAGIGDPNNPQVKLLTAGVEVSRDFVDKLSSRGITEVVISQRDLARMKAFEPQGRGKRVPEAHQYVPSTCVNEMSIEIDKQVEEGSGLSLGDIGTPLSSEFQRPENRSYEDGLQTQWADESDEQVETLGQFYEESCGNQSASIQPLREQCESILDRVREDQDALVCLAASPYSSEYPSRHATHLATMAMAIGIEMGLDEANLIDLGIGCLFHDVGMKTIGVDQFDVKATITASGLKRLSDHPVHSVAIAGRCGDEISENAKIVAYQIHERLDGSGYPRGRKAGEIHELARIASVADAFVALLAPRPHRLGIQGYYAVKHILDDMSAGKFESKVVRALLRTTSLYPIGSYVALTNEHVGRVIRSGGDDFDRPTIEMWPIDRLDSKPAVVNLKNDKWIRISGSIASPRAA